MWGGFNWGQMLLYNNTGSNAAHLGRAEGGRVMGGVVRLRGQSERTWDSSLHMFLLVASWLRLTIKKRGLKFRSGRPLGPS